MSREEWVRWLEPPQFKIRGDSVMISIAQGARAQTVTISEDVESFVMTTRVSTPSYLPDDVVSVLLKQNRHSLLTAFSVTSKKEIIGHASLPKDALDKRQFCKTLEILALESDRLEYLLTGKDVN